MTKFTVAKPLCVILFLVLPFGECVIQEVTWKEDSSIKDRTFGRDLIFSMAEARSSLDCGRWCSRTKNCVTFTFTRKSTSSGSCRGHSSLMTSLSSGSPEPMTEGYKLIGRKALLETSEKTWWTGRACTDDWECPAENSTCFYNQCLCIPGYYYSQSGDNCVPKCAPVDLQTTFMQYPCGLLNSRVLHHQPSGFSLQDCQANCTRDPVCRGITFVRSSGMCLTHSVTPLDADDKAVLWLPDMKPHFYSQLTCA